MSIRTTKAEAQDIHALSCRDGKLRRVLEDACATNGYSLSDLTVLSPQVDPYRLDTPAKHRDGAWIAEQLARFYDRTKRAHWRGLHYAIYQSGLDIKKPDRAIYQNTDEDWVWLSTMAGKAARWLGYIPFDRIKDERNEAPIIHRRAKVNPEARLLIGLNVDIPDADDIEPLPSATGFIVRQAFHFAIFGEKSSLEDILLPIAEKYEADLYLPTGEISDTLLYQMTRDGAEDGWPMVVFTFSDSDPSGYQMSVSIGRKLQALRDLLFPNLSFEVVPVALIPDQVRDLGLASKPMKETEKRADRWFNTFGIEQTEIDALTVPAKAHILTNIADAAFKPYLDRKLAGRVEKAKKAWYRAAQDVIEREIDAERLAAIREEAAAKLETLRAEIDEINDKLDLASSAHFSFPPIEVPEPGVELKPVRQALVSFSDDWITASRAMIERKSYGKP